MGFRFDVQDRKGRRKGAPKKASGLGMVIVFIALAVSIVLGWRIPLVAPLRAYMPFIPESWYYPFVPYLNVLPIQLAVGIVAFILIQFFIMLFWGVLFPPPPRDQYEEQALRLAQELATQRDVTRPRWITILAFLNGLVGAATIGLAIGLVFNITHPLIQGLGTTMGGSGLPPTVRIIWLVIAGFINLGTAIGMEFGAPWGWWIGLYNAVYAIILYTLNYLQIFLGIALLPTVERVQLPDEFIRILICAFGWQLVFQLILVFYFFKPNVIAYFGMGRQSKAMALVITAVIAIIVQFALVLISLFLPGLGG